MLHIFRAYLDILFFRRGPDSLPPSLPLFAITLAVDAALTVMVIALLDADMVVHLLSYLISLVMLFSVVWLLLNALQLDARFLQAVTAILGADIFLTLVQLIIAMGAGNVASIDAVSDAPTLLLALALLHIWWLAMIGFVIKRAATLNLLAAIGVVFSIFVLTKGATDLLLG